MPTCRPARRRPLLLGFPGLTRAGCSMPLRRPPRAAPPADGGERSVCVRNIPHWPPLREAGPAGRPGRTPWRRPSRRLAARSPVGSGTASLRTAGLIQTCSVGRPPSDPGGTSTTLSQPRSSRMPTTRRTSSTLSRPAQPLALDIPDGAGIRQRLPDLLGQRRRVVVAAVAGPLVDPLGMLLKVLAPSLGHLRGRQRDGPEPGDLPVVVHGVDQVEDQRQRRQ